MTYGVARQPEEIVARLRASTQKFGWDRDVLSRYLSFEEAARLLPETRMQPGDAGARARWESTGTTLSRDAGAVSDALVEKLAASWRASIRGLGMTAQQNVVEIRELVWLLGDEELLAFLANKANFGYFGRPMLKAIAARYGLPVAEGA